MSLRRGVISVPFTSRATRLLRETGRQLAPQVAEHYERLGKPGRFTFLVFDRGHEFHDQTAWEFLKKRL